MALLAPAAHAAEITLEIAPPEPEWLLPPTPPPQACMTLIGLRLEACPLQVHPEGIPAQHEQALVLELQPLIAAGDYEAVLTRVSVIYGPELALLEAGDREGFLGTRMPIDGFQSYNPDGALPTPDRPVARPIETGLAPADRDIRQRDEFRVVPTRNVLGEASKVHPDFISASMLYVIGHSYFMLEQYLPAETAFKLALVPLPNHVRAHESLGLLYLRTERYDEAREHLVRAAELGRNTALVHSGLGYLDQKTRRYWAAANAFQKALVLDPDNRSALRGLLHALTETREHAKAKVLVEQLLEDGPDDPELWVYRAHITLAAGDRPLAIASLETALRLGADSNENRQACAALHLESGNIARAVDLLQASSARGLEFALVDQMLGWLENENEWDRFRELSATVDRAALDGVEQSRLLTRRAALAARDGNRRAASTALQEALALDPANADALMALGQIYRAERDYGRAELLLRRASDYDAVRETALVARAEVAIAEEDFERAIAHLRNAVLDNPARADLRRNIDVLEDIVLLRTQP